MLARKTGLKPCATRYQRNARVWGAMVITQLSLVLRHVPVVQGFSPVLSQQMPGMRRHFTDSQ